MGVEGHVETAMKMSGLDINNKKTVSKYSLEMRQRLAIARSFIHNPEILILDEPVNGLDPIGLIEMRELFHKLAEKGAAIIISSHLLNEVRQIADSVVVISQGNIMLKEAIQVLEERYGESLEMSLVEKMRGVNV